MLLGLVAVCLAPSSASGQSFATGVSAGHVDSATPAWVPASQTPVSLPFHFGVVWNGRFAPPTAFTITPPIGSPLPTQGAFYQAIEWDHNCSPTKWVLTNDGTIPATLYPNGMWHIKVTCQTIPGIPPVIPPPRCQPRPT
jgi:hypothetical protein